MTLPPLYVIGAGAVGQALAYIVGSAGLAEAYLVFIDDDRHDDTNLNRCFLAGIEDLDQPKMRAVERFLAGISIGVFAREATVTSYIAAPRRGLRADVAEAEARHDFDAVASCVDKGASRQDIQGLHPRLIVGGSTLGMTAKANVYDGTPGTACLGCHNPAEKDAEQWHLLERMLRSKSRDEQRAYLEGKVDDVEAVIAHLAKSDCGSAGEQMLRAHAIEKPREFSASFVSMTAGILQATELFRRMLYAQKGPRMTVCAFLNGKIEEATISMDAACELCGGLAAKT